MGSRILGIKTRVQKLFGKEGWYQKSGRKAFDVENNLFFEGVSLRKQGGRHSRYFSSNGRGHAFSTGFHRAWMEAQKSQPTVLPNRSKEKKSVRPRVGRR